MTVFSCFSAPVIFHGSPILQHVTHFLTWLLQILIPIDLFSIFLRTATLLSLRISLCMRKDQMMPEHLRKGFFINFNVLVLLRDDS